MPEIKRMTTRLKELFERLKGAEYLPASRSFRLALDEYLPNGP